MNNELSAGSNLSHYRIVRKLGAGGMGEVWLAEDTRLDREVALKLLPAEFTQDADRVRRFMQEAKAASALNHPNIISVYDIGECEAGHFIVMELVKGRRLRDVIVEENSVETLISLGAQMAKALSGAHAAGITHRDIKPDNIMVREDGYVKVLDFGLARLLPTSANDSSAGTLAQQTTPGTIMGTVAYMSPEQARGESASHPSDIFALGIVLYELATGRHPFKADTLVGYLHAITLQTPAPPQQWQPKLPAALNDLLLRMLSKDASQRPIASEIAQVLQAIERGGDTATRRHGDAAIENETMMLPSVNSGAVPTEEGFWVAVLPFKWRGANAELETLAEGLSEDIVMGLSRFSYLRVIARISTLRFTSETSDVRAIGKELGARYVMEGSLRQAGSQLRVAVQLVDASSGAHLWTETYSRSFSPEVIFEIQDDLVPRIVSTVADWYGALPHSMSEAVRLKPPDQLGPYEAVLRGFGYFERISPEEHAAVRAGLERAVAQAPGNADGWALLSMIYGEEHRFGFNAQPDPLGRSVQAARRAVDAGHANHFAWLALAQALFFRKEFVAFREAAERAIALNPMDSSTLEYLAHLLAFAGDWERGCDLAEQARQLNPNHPGWYWVVHFLDAYRKGDYQTARTCIFKSCMRGGGAQLFDAALLTALYGQLSELEAADKLRQTVLAAKPDFLLTLHSEFAKWYQPELVEQLMDGLRKAGLEIADEAGVSTSSPATETRTMAASSPSIAVLPFANISADEENEYFCDGLAEELLNGLAKIEALSVAARTSAFSFKGKEIDIREIGRKLNVSSVLEGSVRKAGNRLRITAQLINVADGYHLWSERYDREMEDLFDIQDELTLAIVEALKVKLLGNEKAAILKRYTDNTEAYELYLKGRFFWGKVSPAGFEKAIEYFNQAILIEPNFALAYAGLADSYAILSQVSAIPARETMPKAREFAQKALSLDADLAEAHTSLGLVLMDYDYDFAGAETHFRKALKLSPNNPTSHQLYGQLLAQLGRHEEADSELRQALKVDPLSVFINCLYGFILFEARRYDEALVQLQKTFELDANFPLTQVIFAYLHQAQGDDSESAESFAKFYELVGSTEDAARVRKSFADGGWSGFVWMMTGTQCPPDVTGYLAATLHASIGEKDAAFAALDKAYENREALLALIKIDPRIDSLRDDSRFDELLRRIGLA
jgi:adenylate cyclase